MNDKVEDFYNKYKSSLNFQLLSKRSSLQKHIKKPEIQSPGLALSGFVKSYKPDRILVFGLAEIEYLNDLDQDLKIKRLEKVITKDTPCVILANNIEPLKEIKKILEKNDIAIFKSDLDSSNIISQISVFLKDEFSFAITMPGTFLEVFGAGVLIQGESFIGKSETALALIQKGHRFISDDIVKITKKDDKLIGSAPKINQHFMEIKGIGIIDVARLYGTAALRSDKVLDIVVNLEKIDDTHFYERGIIEDKYIDILNVNIPYHPIFVTPQRDISLLIETLILNLQSKSQGYNLKKEFSLKILERIAKGKK